MVMVVDVDSVLLVFSGLIEGWFDEVCVFYVLYCDCLLILV